MLALIPLRRPPLVLGRGHGAQNPALGGFAPVAAIQHAARVLPGISCPTGQLGHREIQIDHQLFYFFGVHCSASHIMVSGR